MTDVRWGLLLIGVCLGLAGGCGSPEPAPEPSPLGDELTAAVGLIESGANDAAVTRLEAIVAQAPSNAVAFINLGVAHVQAGHTNKALVAYANAAALDPQNAQPLELAARIYMQAGDWNAARRVLDHANRRDAYSPRILTTLGVVEYRAGDLDAAEAFFEAARQADDTYSSALYNAGVLQRDGRKNIERAAACFEAYLEQAPPDDPRRLAVRTFVASRRAGPAIEEPSPRDDEPECADVPAPAPGPANPPAPVPATPSHVVAALEEAAQAVEAESFDVALITLKQAMARGRHPDLQWRLAALYERQLVMPAKAAAAYQAFAEAYPDDARTKQIPAREPSVSSPDEHPDEVPTTQASLPDTPASVVDTAVNRLWTRALNAHHRTATGEAMVLYKAILDHNPEHFGAWHNLGLVARKEGALDTAQQAFEKALFLRPDWPDSRFMLAVVRHEQGDDDQASALLDALLAARPRHVRAHYLLAVIYANAGRRGMARTHYKHVVRMASDGPFKQDALDWLSANARKPPPRPEA